MNREEQIKLALQLNDAARRAYNALFLQRAVQYTALLENPSTPLPWEPGALPLSPVPAVPVSAPLSPVPVVPVVLVEPAPELAPVLVVDEPPIGVHANLRRTAAEPPPVVVLDVPPIPDLLVPSDDPTPPTDRAPQILFPGDPIPARRGTLIGTAIGPLNHDGGGAGGSDEDEAPAADEPPETIGIHARLRRPPAPEASDLPPADAEAPTNQPSDLATSEGLGSE